MRGEEEVTIPLSRDVLHSFSFFSSQSSTPKMSLVPSDSPAVTLAWEKGRIVKAEEGRENYTEALPHDINHRVSLQCNRQKENVTCYLMVRIIVLSIGTAQLIISNDNVSYANTHKKIEEGEIMR